MNLRRHSSLVTLSAEASRARRPVRAKTITCLPRADKHASPLFLPAGAVALLCALASKLRRPPAGQDDRSISKRTQQPHNVHLFLVAGTKIRRQVSEPGGAGAAGGARTYCCEGVKESRRHAERSTCVYCFAHKPRQIPCFARNERPWRFFHLLRAWAWTTVKPSWQP